MIDDLNFRPHCVYVLKAADDWILYVGMTWNLESRLIDHSWRKPWWPSVAKMSVTVYPDRHHAFRAERVAIGSLYPEHNIAPGYWSLPPARHGHDVDTCGLCLSLIATEREAAAQMDLWIAEDRALVAARAAAATAEAAQC